MKQFIKIAGLISLILMILSVLSSQAEERPISESQVKAAFVFNVAHYVNWPSPNNDTILIGILGKGSLGQEWQKLSGKNMNGKKLTIFKSNDIDEMLRCQIVFIEESNPQKVSRILQVLRDYPLVTIGDFSSFTSMGGTLNVSLLHNHISFSINLAQARAVGINISSNLLKLATEVIQ